jgi:hypothetical protein
LLPLCYPFAIQAQTAIITDLSILLVVLTFVGDYSYGTMHGQSENLLRPGQTATRLKITYLAGFD